MKHQKLALTLHLGEQLTGLSPTVCRRAIAAIRETDAKLGGAELPTFCTGLLCLLGIQTGIDNLTNPDLFLHRCREERMRLLNEAETFLDTVEGKEIPEERAIKPQQ